MNKRNKAKIARGALQTIGGAIPFAGGIFSTISSSWSEREQEKANNFFNHWIQMLRDELIEKERTIVEIMARIDLLDDEVSKRIESKEYQSLLKKAFREWSGTESDYKRILIRNILSNAASTAITDDDVVRLFVDWIGRYSELHFQVISAVFNTGGIGRGEIWRKIGKGDVREDSAEADLYKLLFRDLTTGGIVRQERKTDYYGNYLKKKSDSKTKSRTMKSAFDDNDLYVLTSLGSQFIHYAMTDLPLRIEMPNTKED